MQTEKLYGTPLRNMKEQKKVIDMTLDELNEWLASLSAPEDDSYYPDADPHFKLEHKPDEQRSNRWFSKRG